MYKNMRRTSRDLAPSNDGGGFKKTVPVSETIAGRKIWAPKMNPGELFRDAPSQDENFRFSMVSLSRKTDRHALCSGANEIVGSVSTLSEREQAIKKLTELLGSTFSDVTSSATYALRKLRATDTISAVERAIDEERNLHAKGSMERDLMKLRSYPNQPTSPEQFKQATGYTGK